jgi:hypothetical protein
MSGRCPAATRAIWPKPASGGLGRGVPAADSETDRRAGAPSASSSASRNPAMGWSEKWRPASLDLAERHQPRLPAPRSDRLWPPSSPRRAAHRHHCGPGIVAFERVCSPLRVHDVPECADGGNHRQRTENGAGDRHASPGALASVNGAPRLIPKIKPQDADHEGDRVETRQEDADDHPDDPANQRGYCRPLRDLLARMRSPRSPQYAAAALRSLSRRSG